MTHKYTITPSTYVITLPYLINNSQHADHRQSRLVLMAAAKWKEDQHEFRTRSISRLYLR